MIVTLGGLGLKGLAAAAALSATDIYQLAVNAGFPPDMAVRMTAVALRESSGVPGATNIRAPGTKSAIDPGENSIGLWQINTLPGANPQWAGADLTNPAVNAQAAYQIWAGNEKNFQIAWGQDAANFMPQAEAAAAAVDLGGGSVGGGSTIDVGISGDGSGDGGGSISTMAPVAVGAGLLFLYLASR